MENTEVEEYRVIDKDALHSQNNCKFCSRPLSIAPVYGLEYPSGVMLETCGRCYYRVYKHDGNKWRQQAYENIARYLTFPCAYKNRGCNETLRWNDVSEHEANCVFPIIACPANDNEFYVGFYCPWEGTAQDLTTHICDKHKESFMDPPHFDEFPLTSEVYFTNVSDTVFMIVFLRETNNKYSCCVLVRGGELVAQTYRYQVELTNSSKTSSIILRRNKVENWFHVESTLCRKESLLEIDCDVIENLIKHDSTSKRISIKFGIVKKSKKEIKQIYEAAGRSFLEVELATQVQVRARETPDEKLLAELECPICNEYMVPPIYICSNGHSLCNDCLTKVQTCPNCRCPLGTTRNFTLENLTTKVLYNCRNKDAGCSFITTSENIREHEKSCNLSTIPCILKCGLNFRKANLWPHITSKHQDTILETGEIHKREVNDKRESHYVNFTCGEIFRFSVKEFIEVMDNHDKKHAYSPLLFGISSETFIPILWKRFQKTRGSSNQPFKFNVQWLANEKEKPRFKFTLEIIDKSPYKLTITFVCLVLPINETPFKNTNITVPWDLIKSYVSDNARHFHFKYTISPLSVPISS